tara:strand:- start:40 stop:1059 length:1020 start_codon:yes stop_codon:yes gene_type:complete
MEEEYVPQSQQPIEQAQPQSIPDQNEMFLKLMNEELNRDPNVSQEENEELYNYGVDAKDRFSKADKNEQAAIQKETLEKAQKMTVPEEFKKQIAETLSDTESFGHNPIEKLGPYANDVIDIIKGGSQPIFKDNVPGYEMHNGEWMSMANITDLFSGMKVDQGSREGMKVLLDDVIRKAENVQPGDDPSFNYQKEYNNIKEKIVETGDLKSLTLDKIFPNRTFKDDLISAIKQGTYKEMGIADNQIKDPTPEDGRITEEDAKVISEVIMQDKNMLKDYLAEYYTKALEQNHNNNLSPDVRRILKMNQTKPQVTQPVDTDPPQLISEGTVDNNGVWTPNKK